MASAIARKCAPATAAASLGPCGSHAIILARSSLSQDKWVRIAVTLTRQAAQAREHGRARCIMPCARRRCCCPAALRELERAGRLTRGARQFEKRRRALECMRASRQGPPPRAGRESGQQPGTESQKAAWVRLARPPRLPSDSPAAALSLRPNCTSGSRRRAAATHSALIRGALGRAAV